MSVCTDCRSPHSSSLSFPAGSMHRRPQEFSQTVIFSASRYNCFPLFKCSCVSIYIYIYIFVISHVAVLYYSKCVRSRLHVFLFHIFLQFFNVFHLCVFVLFVFHQCVSFKIHLTFTSPRSTLLSSFFSSLPFSLSLLLLSLHNSSVILISLLQIQVPHRSPRRVARGCSLGGSNEHSEKVCSSPRGKRGTAPGGSPNYLWKMNILERHSIFFHFLSFFLFFLLVFFFVGCSKSFFFASIASRLPTKAHT